MRHCTGLRQNLWASHITARRATVTQLYDQLVRKEIIQRDEDQRRMAEACTPLVKLLQEGGAIPPGGALSTASTFSGAAPHDCSETLFRLTRSRAPSESQRPWGGLWSRMTRAFASSRKPECALDCLRSECLDPLQKRGLYLWGSVGIGKTMMLDLFDLVESDHVKRRTHLHSFMVELSDRLVAAEHVLTRRRRAASTEAEKAALKTLRPIDLVVHDVLVESPVLCFDEFQTFDVAHAALLSAFFTCALRKGLYLFTTSNRPPEELCNISASFQAFLPVLYAHCNVVECGNITDYRKRHLSSGFHSKLFVFPASKEATESIISRVELGHRRRMADRLAPNVSVDAHSVARTPYELEWVKDDVLWHHGRAMLIPYRCGGVALFDFGDIIGGQRQDLCSADFQLLATNYHTVIITNVPQIGVMSRNVAHQFIVLIDELYQSNVKLLLTTQVPWKALLSSKRHGAGVEALDSSEHLYSEGEDDRSGYQASYQFRNEEELVSLSRIESRLSEMGCRHYVLRDHARFVVSDFDFAALIDDSPPDSHDDPSMEGSHPPSLDSPIGSH